MNDEIRPESLSTVALSKELDAHISARLPWSQTRPDFSKIEGRHLDWGRAEDHEVEAFLHSTPLNGYPYWAVLHSANDPVRFFASSEILQRIDEATYPHEALVVFGAEKKDGEWSIAKSYVAYLHPGRDIWVCDV